MDGDDIERLIAELASLRLRVQRLEVTQGYVIEAPQDAAPVARNELEVGDRVKITNRVRRPATWPRTIIWSEEKARTGTVTRVTPEQVHFVTDDGTRTRRAPNNLRRIEQQQANSRER